ncbi:hypothetical protein DAI22_06g141000 [Oryza sativa Japonica Group]|nr:hypothetical protein DAI22_06g141000 [Oryza sativa Japonica Group]
MESSEAFLNSPARLLVKVTCRRACPRCGGSRSPAAPCSASRADEPSLAGARRRCFFPKLKDAARRCGLPRPFPSFWAGKNMWKISTRWRRMQRVRRRATQRRRRRRGGALPSGGHLITDETGYCEGDGVSVLA